MSAAMGQSEGDQEHATALRRPGIDGGLYLVSTTRRHLRLTVGAEMHQPAGLEAREEARTLHGLLDVDGYR